MEGESITVLLFCGIDDEIKAALDESLLHAAAAAALRHDAGKNQLVIAQPLPADGSKGVQLQVDHIPRCCTMQAL